MNRPSEVDRHDHLLTGTARILRRRVCAMDAKAGPHDDAGDLSIVTAAGARLRPCPRDDESGAWRSDARSVAGFAAWSNGDLCAAMMRVPIGD